MYQIDFNHPQHVHFIGIGGISMSGLAEILLSKGFTISGSDTSPSSLTGHLSSLGAIVSFPQKASNITDGVKVVVYTAAIHEDNEELKEAKRRHLPLLTRAGLLGQLMKNYAMPIAVSGTHGKTTTTSMLSHILLAAGMDPTISVGGILHAIGGNTRTGNSEIFLTEACEYTNSFLSFYPRIALILNIEEDHMDFFKDLEDVRSSFRRFAQLLPADGVLIINNEIDRLGGIISGLKCKVVTYSAGESHEPVAHPGDIHGNNGPIHCGKYGGDGLSIPAPADYMASDISFKSPGNASFELIRHGKKAGRITLSVSGIHNVSNALAAICAAETLGVPVEDIRQGLLSFHGTDRRFQYKGKRNGVTIIDDYAHHPTEIRASLTMAGSCPHREIWCVFQPHTYSRTKTFFTEFAKALTLADHVILADIYPARETDTLGMSSKALAMEVKRLGADAYYLPGFKEIEDFVLKNCIPGDMLITMGAGDVVSIADSLLSD